MQDKTLTYDMFVQWMREHDYPKNVLLSRHDYAIVKNIISRQMLSIDDKGEHLYWEDCKIRPNPPIAVHRPDLVDISERSEFRGWGEGE